MSKIKEEAEKRYRSQLRDYSIQLKREAFIEGAEWMKQELDRPKKEFDSLIERLENCNNIKYPDRPYSSSFREYVIESWTGKVDELKDRVETLEKELNINTLNQEE